MSSTPGAEARANKYAGRGRRSDINELRDNVADVASSVGGLVTNTSGLTTWQPMLSKRQVRH